MGAKVIGISNNVPTRPSHFDVINLKTKIKHFTLDICDFKKLSNQFKKHNPDFIFHLAAQSRVQPSFDDPEESLRVNVLGTSKVLEWSRKNNTKIIYAGSSSKHHNPSDSPYAMYKYLGEETCKLYKSSFNLNVEIARFYNVFGPGENIDEIYKNQDPEGVTVEDELRRTGQLGDVPCKVFPIKAYYELHIEQGPVLENENISIGVVTGGQGSVWTHINLYGQGAHAGTTPMDYRKDPMMGASRIITFARTKHL